MCYSNLLWIMIKISNNDPQFVWRMEHNSYIPDYRDKPSENLHSEDLPKRPFTTLSRSNSLHQSSMPMILGMTFHLLTLCICYYSKYSFSVFWVERRNNLQSSFEVIFNNLSWKMTWTKSIAVRYSSSP